MVDINLATSGEGVYEDSDSGWKEAVEIYLKEFLSFFFSRSYTEVDLEREYEFLDKELEKIVRDAKTGQGEPYGWGGEVASRTVSIYLLTCYFLRTPLCLHEKIKTRPMRTSAG